MKLINGKYKMKPIQESGNYDRLMDRMDSNLSARCGTSKVSQLPQNFSSLRKKMRYSVLQIMNERHLMYANDIIINFNNEIVIQWFAHFGTSNVSLSMSKGKCTLQYKRNNTKTLITEEYIKVSDAIKTVAIVLDEFPDVNT